MDDRERSLMNDAIKWGEVLIPQATVKAVGAVDQAAIEKVIREVVVQAFEAGYVVRDERDELEKLAPKADTPLRVPTNGPVVPGLMDEGAWVDVDVPPQTDMLLRVPTSTPPQPSPYTGREQKETPPLRKVTAEPKKIPSTEIVRGMRFAVEGYAQTFEALLVNATHVICTGFREGNGFSFHKGNIQWVYPLPARGAVVKKKKGMGLQNGDYGNQEGTIYRAPTKEEREPKKTPLQDPPLTPTVATGGELVVKKKKGLVGEIIKPSHTASGYVRHGRYDDDPAFQAEVAELIRQSNERIKEAFMQAYGQRKDPIVRLKEFMGIIQ